MIASSQIGTVWDMLKFHADKFVKLSSLLRSLTMHFMRSNDFGDVERGMIAKSLNESMPLLEEIGLRQSLKKARSISTQTGFAGYNATHFSLAIDELQERIRDELEDRFILSLNEGEAGLYANTAQGLVSPEVVSKFPSLIYEIEECAKCGALGRDTASAFHAIRCLEGVIRAISRCLGIADPIKGVDRNWTKLMQKIDDQIKLKWPSASDRFSGDGKLFQDLHAALHAMQNPYRNDTMHLDATYSRDEAEVIRIVVRGFLITTSSRMNENGEPKVP